MGKKFAKSWVTKDVVKSIFKKVLNPLSFGALIHLLLDDSTGGFLRFDGAVLIIGELAVGVLDIGRDFLVLSLPVLQNALGVFVLLVFYGSSVCTFRSLLCRSFCFGTFFVLYRDCVFRGLSVGGQRGGSRPSSRWTFLTCRLCWVPLLSARCTVWSSAL